MSERRVALFLVVALTIARSLPFVFRSSFAFDSDQAIFGLMAKHIATGRAFPLFMYGTSYILAVEAWLAAPLFLIAGVSVAALKLPLLAMNVAIAALLVTLLEREAGLRPRDALIASLFFVLAPPGTATELLAPIGGNVEPLLYVLLLWLTRKRPVLFGAVLGVGFLQREFTIYGLAALVIVELASGIRARADGRRLLSALRVAAEIWLIAQFLRPLASPAGPGTTVADLVTPPNNLANLAGRICFDVHSLATGIGRLITVHWPVLFGTKVVPIGAFLVESSISQGAAWSGIILAGAFGLMIAGIVTQRWNDPARVDALPLPRVFDPRRRDIGTRLRGRPMRRARDRNDAVRPVVGDRRGRARGFVFRDRARAGARARPQSLWSFYGLPCRRPLTPDFGSKPRSGRRSPTRSSSSEISRLVESVMRWPTTGSRITRRS